MDAIQVAVILGAGFSVPAGLPVAGRLFDTYTPIDAASRELRCVLDEVPAAFRAWRSRNELAPAEQFVADVAAGVVAETTWPDMLRFIAARLAGSDVERRLATLMRAGVADPRYINALHMPHNGSDSARFIQMVRQSCTKIAFVTFNYDILLERVLTTCGHAWYYGGFPVPQLVEGRPTRVGPAYNRRGLESLSNGAQVLKLHGSLSWSLEKSGVRFWADCRPAFRRRNPALLVPPTPEKTPMVELSGVWKAAASALRSARTWLVCGYSLPEYDHAARELVSEAAAGRELRVYVVDPRPEPVGNAIKGLAPSAEVLGVIGLPPKDWRFLEAIRT